MICESDLDCGLVRRFPHRADEPQSRSSHHVRRRRAAGSVCANDLGQRFDVRLEGDAVDDALLAQGLDVPDLLRGRRRAREQEGDDGRKNDALRQSRVLCGLVGSLRPCGCHRGPWLGSCAPRRGAERAGLAGQGIPRRAREPGSCRPCSEARAGSLPAHLIPTARRRRGPRCRGQRGGGLRGHSRPAPGGPALACPP